jgi:hypothetical protein
MIFEKWPKDMELVPGQGLRRGVAISIRDLPLCINRADLDIKHQINRRESINSMSNSHLGGVRSPFVSRHDRSSACTPLDTSFVSIQALAQVTNMILPIEITNNLYTY